MQKKFLGLQDVTRKLNAKENHGGSNMCNSKSGGRIKIKGMTLLHQWLSERNKIREEGESRNVEELSYIVSKQAKEYYTFFKKGDERRTETKTKEMTTT